MKTEEIYGLKTEVASLSKCIEELEEANVKGLQHTVELGEEIAKLKAKQDALLAEERKKSEEAQAKLKAIEDAQRAQEAAEEKIRVEAVEKEKRAQEAREALERAEKLAPDKEKLESFVVSLESIKFPIVESVEAREIAEGASDVILRLIESINNHIEEL